MHFVWNIVNSSSSSSQTTIPCPPTRRKTRTSLQADFSLIIDNLVYYLWRYYRIFRIRHSDTKSSILCGSKVGYIFCDSNAVAAYKQQRKKIHSMWWLVWHSIPSLEKEAAVQNSNQHKGTQEQYLSLEKSYSLVGRSVVLTVLWWS